jgi:hypothetical protein
LTAVDTATRHKLIWDWLRLFLGLAQMFLAVAAAGSLLVAGLHPITWALVIGAPAATLVSRLLYRGRPARGPEREKSL